MGLPILIADEEDAFRRHLVGALSGHRVVEAPTGAEALQHLRGEPYPLVIAGMELPGLPAPALLEETRSLASRPLVVVTIDSSRAPEAGRALRMGADDYLVKPCDEDVLAAVLRRSIHQVTLARENRALLESLKRNVEALGQQNQRLEQLAIRDGLTGLYNHRYFREALDVELSRCRRYHRVLALVFADIDYFKKYNDEHGHLAGDKLLSSLGRLITRNSRKSTIIARYGGEEFVLLVPEADRPSALQYAEKIRSLVESHRADDGAPGGVTLSMGVSTFPADGADADALIQTADDRLYRAKDAGRNTVCG